MDTRIDEIADGIFRLSTLVAEVNRQDGGKANEAYLACEKLLAEMTDAAQGLIGKLRETAEPVYRNGTL